MYQIKIIATCSKCGKQYTDQRTATSATLLFKHMLFKMRKDTDFDGQESICIDCQIKEMNK